MHNTSNLTTGKKKSPFTEQDTLFLCPLFILEMVQHHDSQSPGAINTPKCENPFGFAEFLPNLAYVWEIANEILYCYGLLGKQNAGSGLWLNGLQNHQLTSHCSPSMHPWGWYCLTPRAWKSGLRSCRIHYAAINLLRVKLMQVLCNRLYWFRFCNQKFRSTCRFKVVAL